MHARLSVERRDANSRVIGKRRKPRAAAGVARFGERVLDETAMRLLGIGHTEIRLRDDFHSERREERLDFTQLAGIRRGKDEFFHAAILTCETFPSSPEEGWRPEGAGVAVLPLRGGESSKFQRRFLLRNELGYPLLRQRDQSIHLCRSERLRLGSTLDLDEIP